VGAIRPTSISRLATAFRAWRGGAPLAEDLLWSITARNSALSAKQEFEIPQNTVVHRGRQSVDVILTMRSHGKRADEVVFDNSTNVS
jgi:hypothetical protein